MATVDGVNGVERNYTLGFELLLEPVLDMKIRGYKDMVYHWDECPRGDTCFVKTNTNGKTYS